MIISGGVTIYPQEVENVLATHPISRKSPVSDFQIRYGEEVKAVVELKDPKQATRQWPGIDRILPQTHVAHKVSAQCRFPSIAT